jgi:inner membrane transporter RhtA
VTTRPAAAAAGVAGASSSGRRVATGAGLVVGAVVSVQVGAALAKNLFPQLGATGVVWLRLGIAALILVVSWRPRAWRWSRGDLGLVATLGVVFALMNTTFYLSLDRVPLGVAVTVEFIGPLGLAALSSRRRLDAVWVALAATGIVLLVRTGPGLHLDLVGVGLALAAGVCWATYIVLSARVGQRIPGGAGLAAALVVAALLTTPLGVASVRGHLTWSALLAAAGVAVLSSALPWSLELEALRRVPTGVFGILMSIEPAVAALSGWALLSEDLLGRQWLGIVVVVLASAGAAMTSARARADLAAANMQP